MAKLVQDGFAYGQVPSGCHWRAYLGFQLWDAEDGSHYSLLITECGLQSLEWGYAISSGMSATCAIVTEADPTPVVSGSATGWSVNVPSGATAMAASGASCSANGTNGKWFARTTESQYVNVTATITNASGYESGVSTATMAVEIPALQTYRVTYNSNGHGVSPADQVKAHDVALTLAAAITADHWTMTRWSTKADGSGTTYNAGASYTANAPLTLYAVWTPKTYRVTYNANGGSGAPSAKTVTYGTAWTVSSTKPTRAGYKFLGWATSQTATAPTYASGARVDGTAITAATTFWAVWERYASPVLTVSASRDSATPTTINVRWSWTAGNGATISTSVKAENGTTVKNASAIADSTAASKSGTASITGCSAGLMWTVTMTVTDSLYASPVTAVAIVPVEKAIIDVGNEGRSLGLGMAAPEEGLGIGFDKVWVFNPLQFCQAIGALHASGHFNSSRFSTTDLEQMRKVIVPSDNAVLDTLQIVTAGNVAMLRAKGSMNVAVGTGNVGNTTLFTVNEDWRPAVWAAGTSMAYGPGLFAYLHTNGNVQIVAMAGVGIEVGGAWEVGFTYILANPPANPM